MENGELQENFRKALIAFSKDNNVKIYSKEFKALVRSWDEYLTLIDIDDNQYGKDYGKDTPAYKKLAEFHESLVQQCIDFINSNDEIKEMIEKKWEELHNEWNHGRTEEEMRKYPIEPDVRVYFGIDGMDDSLENGQWSAGTESSLNIACGGKSVICRM